jgi:hypothetical protein
VVCDTDSETECDTSSVDDRRFECECGHVETGQDADDNRYLVRHHGECGCTDCDEDCEDCEAAGCEQFDVCCDCEAKYDKIDEERLEGLKEEDTAKSVDLRAFEKELGMAVDMGMD